MDPIEIIRRRLQTDHGPPLGDPTASMAAVAVILRSDGASLECLLIKRAQREGDPWSGHMAFPGGRWQADDPSPLATAIRETYEEIALPLEASAELLGRLDDQPAYAKGKRINMVIRPFVFRLTGPAPAFGANAEVEEVLWADLRDLRSGRVNTFIEHSIEGNLMKLPGYTVGTGIVWGLTYRMLGGLFQLLEDEP